MADMRQFVHHHIFDGVWRVGHQVQGEAEPVFPGAAAEAGAGGGDGDAGGLHAHALRPQAHQRRELLCGLPPPQGGLLRRRLRVGGHVRSPRGQVLVQPSPVAVHKAGDVRVRGVEQDAATGYDEIVFQEDKR